MDAEPTLYERCQQRWPTWFIPCVEFHVPAGWQTLVWELFEDLERFPVPANFHVLQIKEKFGELRCYAVPSTPVIDQRIHRAEKLSRSTCDTCGTQRYVDQRGSVLRTLCEACRAALRRSDSESSCNAS